ncbi:MAG: hypothetical protein ACOY0T_13695 [Myxococcota bacterium]
MYAELPEEALSLLRDVRWQLLESFALARQEGMAEPVGFVLDPSFPYARGLGQRLLMLKSAGPTRRTVTCMERSQLNALFVTTAPDITDALREVSDEPGRWAAVILAQRGWVLTGSWQELFTLEAKPNAAKSHRN